MEKEEINEEIKEELFKRKEICLARIKNIDLKKLAEFCGYRERLCYPKNRYVGSYFFMYQHNEPFQIEQWNITYEIVTKFKIPFEMWKYSLPFSLYKIAFAELPQSIESVIEYITSAIDSAESSYNKNPTRRRIIKELRKTKGKGR